MKYNQLGRTGLFVSELCLGTMTFGGGAGFWKAIGALQQDEADGLLRRRTRRDQLPRYRGRLFRGDFGADHRPGDP